MAKKHKVLMDLVQVHDFVNEANKHGLIAEVVLEAIKEAQENPKAPLESILAHAKKEWDV